MPKPTEYSVQELKNLSADTSVSPPIPREGIMGKSSDGRYFNLNINEKGQAGIYIGDGAQIDAFGRLRVSTPYTLFDHKQIFDDGDISNTAEQSPLLYDNAETAGSGTSTTFNPTESSTTLSVGNTTAGTRVRQTKRRFNYQPGKSLLVLMTFVMGTPTAGITRREGYFDENNGIYLEHSGTTVQFVRRTKTSGSVVNNAVLKSAWNIDPMDGTGVSGVNLDWTKTQIMIIDMEWLGVGRVRVGFVVDGNIYYAHEFLNANNLSVVYMQTPNLPLRSEISNDGTASAAGLVQICSTVISEGGLEDNGIVFSTNNGNTQVDANAAGTLYACIGLKLRSSHLGATIKTISMSMLAATVNDNFRWELLYNPTVAGTFTYANVTNSACMTAKGATANTVTGGTLINSGYGSQSAAVDNILINSLNLGSTISGTADSIVLCVSPVGGSTNLDIYSSITWRELL